MHRTQYLCTGTCCFCSLLVVAGCGSSDSHRWKHPSRRQSTNSTNSTSSTSSTPPSNVTGPSVYVMGGKNSPSVLVFPQSASGRPTQHSRFMGGRFHWMELGNVYVFAGSAINEYSANYLNGPPIRTLTVGPGTAVSIVQDVMASSTGEVFVSDSTGIAVFSPTATGNATPVRTFWDLRSEPVEPQSALALDLSRWMARITCTWKTLPTQLSLSSGPRITAMLFPARTISGPLTRVSGSGNYITGMSTDAVGNLYVLCLCKGTDGTGRYDFGVFEFDPVANGNVAPTRFVTAPEMYPYFFNDGVSVSIAAHLRQCRHASRHSNCIRIFFLLFWHRDSIQHRHLGGGGPTPNRPGLPCIRGSRKIFREIGLPVLRCIK